MITPETLSFNSTQILMSRSTSKEPRKTVRLPGMRPNLPHKFASKKTRTLKCMVTLIFSIYLNNLNIICRYDISKLLLRGYILLVHPISAPIFTSKKAQGLWCCPSDRLGVEVALAQTIFAFTVATAVIFTWMPLQRVETQPMRWF